MIDKTEEVVPCKHELNQNQKLWVGKLCRCIWCGEFLYAAKDSGKVNMSKKERLRSRRITEQRARNEIIVYGKVLSHAEREEIKRQVSELPSETVSEINRLLDAPK